MELFNGAAFDAVTQRLRHKMAATVAPRSRGLTIVRRNLQSRFPGGADKDRVTPQRKTP
jgi:hypothetical protein